MKVTGWVLGMVQTNCYCIYNEGEENALIVDPGAKGDYIIKKLDEKGLKAQAILLTHAHFDHIGAVETLVRKYDCSIYACDKEKEIALSSELNLSSKLIKKIVLKDVTFLPDGSEISEGSLKCRLIATPGHTEGSCCYYFEREGVLFTGDTLFCGSVGRTDLPTGSSSTLVRSIREKIMVLPDDTACFPGHGEPTSIGTERAINPFI